MAYAYSSAANYRPILFASSNYPFYLPFTARKAAKWLGIHEEKASGESVAVKDGALNYPLKPLDIEAPVRPLNIVWLVAESLRFDMLDAKVMPQTWAFSLGEKRNLACQEAQGSIIIHWDDDDWMDYSYNFV